MFATYLYTAICTDRTSLGGGGRFGFIDLRNPFDATNKSHADIQADQKSATAIQLLLGHTKLESTVRYLGIEVNALEISEQTEI